MASLDPLPTATSNNTSVIGTSRLLKISTFSEKFDLVEIKGDSFVKVVEEAGCIHYDTFQTDCRRGKRTMRTCTALISILAMRCRLNILQVNLINTFLMSLEPSKHSVYALCLLLG